MTIDPMEIQNTETGHQRGPRGPRHPEMGSIRFPRGRPDTPSNLPVSDRPIVAKNLAAKAALIGPTPSIGADKIIAKVKKSKSTLIKHRCFDLPHDDNKGKPGRKAAKGKSETDTWIAKAADYRALAEAAFELIYPNQTPEGYKWQRFERDIFAGTSILSDEKPNNISASNTELILGLTNRLLETTKSTGIEKFWDRLADAPFDLKAHAIPDENDEEQEEDQRPSSCLTDDQIKGMGLEKAYRSPLDKIWQTADVQPKGEPYWAKVIIELGRIAVPHDFRVLEIPEELRALFNVRKKVPPPGHFPGDDDHDDSDDLDRFPAAAEEWLLKNAWNGELPESPSDVIDWTYDDASEWKDKIFYFDCRLFIKIYRGLDGKAKIDLQASAPHMDGYFEGRLYSAWDAANNVLRQLQDPNAGHKIELRRVNENFYPEIIVDDKWPHEPRYLTVYELGWAAQDLEAKYSLDDLSQSDALDLLRVFPFIPDITVAEQLPSVPFPKDTVLSALFANLALGDCPERIDRLLQTQAHAITDFGNDHLDNLVNEAQALLDQLD